MKKRSEFTEKQRKAAAAAAVVIFIALSAVIGWFIGRPMLKFVSEPEKFRAWVDAHGAWGKLAYMGMVILQVIVAIIPGEPLEIGGGYAFGALWGTALCLIAAAAGSVLVFLFVRRFGVKVVEVFFPAEKLQSLRFLHSSPRRDFLFLLVFTIPGTPKDMLSYFAGLKDIKFGTFLLISSLGRIPSAITSILTGKYAIIARNCVKHGGRCRKCCKKQAVCRKCDPIFAGLCLWKRFACSVKESRC